MSNLEVTSYSLDRGLPDIEFSYISSLFKINNIPVNTNDIDVISIVNKSNTNIGVVTFKFDTELRIVTVRILQSPRVCRLSILALIESSVVLLQDIIFNIDTVVYENVSYAHRFKFNSLFDLNEDDFQEHKIILEYNQIKVLDRNKISNREIILIDGNKLFN